MRKRILLLMALFAELTVTAQVNKGALLFDLGELKGTEKTPQTLPAQEMRVEKVLLKNAFPNRVYVLTVQEEVRVLPTLNTGGTVAGGAPTNCSELETEFNSVLQFATVEDPKKTEQELKEKLEKLEKTKNSSGCTDVTLLTKITQLQNNCIREFTLSVPVNMTLSKNYTFKISTGDRTFQFAYTGKDRGRWLTSYGFLFTSRKLEPPQYYTDEVGKDSFRITKKTRHDLLDLRFTPTIFFSYFLDKNLDKPFNHSLSAGLGFNFSSPVVSLGYNLMWNSNIGVSTGVVFYEQQKLDSRYNENKILKENLDEDKLYEKTVFRPNIYLAINIRLGDNPFKTEKNTQ